MLYTISSIYSSEEKLKILANKWRKVAQDAASDLWDLVKANEGDFSSSGGDRDRDNEYLDDGKAQFGFTSRWGWADDDDKKLGANANTNEDDAGNLSDSSLPSPSALTSSYSRLRRKSSSSKPRLSTTLTHSYLDASRDSDPDDDERGKGEEDDRAISEEPEPVPEQKWSMGTMLGVLGIAAKDTLKWDEEEEEFVGP